MHASEDVPEALPWWEILTVAKFSHYSSSGCANLPLRVWAACLTMSDKDKMRCRWYCYTSPTLSDRWWVLSWVRMLQIKNLINLDDKIHTETSEAGWQVITLPHDMWLVVWFSESWTYCCNCCYLGIGSGIECKSIREWIQEMHMNLF